MCVDQEGRIYVADYKNHRVQIFDEHGTFIAKFGKQGQAGGELYYPWGIGITSKGNIVVGEVNNNRISIFDHKGTFVKVIYLSFFLFLIPSSSPFFPRKCA